jgi:hypothetical protein
MQKLKRTSALLLALFLFCRPLPAFAAEIGTADASVDQAIAETANFLLDSVKDPQVASVGGEWAVIGLARSGANVPQEWCGAYEKNLEAFLSEDAADTNKYTDYSRIILALVALGKNPADFFCRNPLEKLADYGKILRQGINGPIFALIALNSGGFEIPADPAVPVQTTRDLLIGAITGRELPGGGFSLAEGSADPDVTAMALQALAPYKDRADIRPIVDRALARLSSLQEKDGGFTSRGAENCESVSQVLIALTALGIDPETDARFRKDHSAVENLLNFHVPGGGFLLPDEVKLTASFSAVKAA